MMSLVSLPHCHGLQIGGGSDLCHHVETTGSLLLFDLCWHFLYSVRPLKFLKEKLPELSVSTIEKPVLTNEIT